MWSTRAEKGWLYSDQCGRHPALLLADPEFQQLWLKLELLSFLSLSSVAPHCSPFPTHSSFKKIKAEISGKPKPFQYIVVCLFNSFFFPHLSSSKNSFEAWIFIPALILSPGSPILFRLGLKELGESKTI